jgi:hypothetical protein
LENWKTWLFANRPQLVHEVYLTIARSELSRNLQYVEALQVLLTDAALSPFLGITTVQLLTEFPNAAMPSLIRLLSGVLGCIEIWQEFFAIAEKILDEPGEIGCEQHDAWLVAAYLVSPERYAQRIADTASDRVEIAWQIRDFLRYGTAHAVALSLNQMAELTYIFARHSLNIYPSVGILIAIKIRPMRSDLCVCLLTKSHRTRLKKQPIYSPKC